MCSVAPHARTIDSHRSDSTSSDDEDEDDDEDDDDVLDSSPLKRVPSRRAATRQRRRMGRIARELESPDHHRDKSSRQQPRMRLRTRRELSSSEDSSSEVDVHTAVRPPCSGHRANRRRRACST